MLPQLALLTLCADVVCGLCGCCLQSDPNMQRMMTTMQDPEYKAKVGNGSSGMQLCTQQLDLFM
jgi:hypothetical protein